SSVCTSARSSRRRKTPASSARSKPTITRSSKGCFSSSLKTLASALGASLAAQPAHETISVNRILLLPALTRSNDFSRCFDQSLKTTEVVTTRGLMNPVQAWHQRACVVNFDLVCGDLSPLPSNVKRQSVLTSL